MENKSYKPKRRAKPELIEFNIPLQKKCEHNFCIYKGSEIQNKKNSEWICTQTYSCSFCGLNQKQSHEGF